MCRIARRAQGFIYYISITGVTGTATPSRDNVEREIRRIRTHSDLPLVVGFGISTPEQARELASLADGIVIGSAFVRLIAENADSPELAARVSSFAREIKKAMQE